MTSPHTLASITADLIANGIPRHFREEAQSPSDLCWFLLESTIDERSLYLFNTRSITPATIILWHFLPSRNGWEFDSSCDGWALDASWLYYEGTNVGLSHEEINRYEHTTIREAVALISFIDQYNAKHSITAA